MSEFNFEVNGGASIRLKTAGKYCDRDILVSGVGGRNPLELLYTEGAEITAEDWGSTNLRVFNGSGTGTADINQVFLNTKFKKITFPNTQTRAVGFYSGLLEEYDSGNDMTADNTISRVFYTCSNLKKIYMGENFLPFANYGFSGCTLLKEVHYRGTIDKWAVADRNANVTRATPFCASGGGSFYLGDSTEPLTEIYLTTATAITVGAFYNFKDITRVRLGASVATISASAFAKCALLDTVILEGDTVKTLANTNAFTDTPIASGTGVVYIRPETVDEATLVAEYQAATNWSTFANIKPFSEYVGGAE